MDIDYILRREQISLHNALVAASLPARIAHEGLADAYGAQLVKAGFPRPTRDGTYPPFRAATGITDPEHAGGSLRRVHPPLARRSANDV